MLSYARVRFTVAVGWFTVANGGITVVEGGCIVVEGGFTIGPPRSLHVLSHSVLLAHARARVRQNAISMGGSRRPTVNPPSTTMDPPREWVVLH